MVTVENMHFGFLMSPDYGLTGTQWLNEHIFVKVYQYGRLDGTVPSGLKQGKYEITHWVDNQEISTTEPLTAADANAYLETLLKS